MKVLVLGTRGIPDILGGVETHCQELYPRLVELGCDISVITRTPYIPKKSRLSGYRGVKLKHIYAPRKKSLEAIIHTFLGVLYARINSPDILHIHAIGPSLMIPLARALGLKVIVTHHGPDYDRQKWGPWAKRMLRAGEYCAATFANKIIVISKVIDNILREKYGRDDCILIHNGVNIAVRKVESDYITSLGLSAGRYVVGIGRFVEEKGFHDLIEAYKELESDEIKLVLVGDADHETIYSKKLKMAAVKNNVVMTGFIKGRELEQIFTHAKLFVMPSYHEGLPIALLEAMSFNLPVLVSNIPANVEVSLLDDDYFATGDIEMLTKRLREKLASNSVPDYSKLLEDKYNWDKVAESTYAAYRNETAGV